MKNLPKLLLVDDDPIKLELYSDIFTAEGYEVCTAANEAGVFACLERHLPDLVLLDIMLQGESGLDILKKIKENDAYRYMYVVLITSHLISSEHQARGLELGADGYMTRPIEKRELLARVQAFIRHKHDIDALRKSEAMFKKIIQRNPDAMLVVDGEGYIRFANPASEELFRLTMDDLLSRIFGYPVIKGEHTEIQIMRKGSDETFAEMRSIDIEWNEDPAYLTSIRNISKRKKFEEELKMRAAELAAVNSLGRTVSVNLDLKETITTSLREITKIVDVDTAFLFLRDERKLMLKEIYPGESKLFAGSVPEHRVGQCLCGISAKSKVPVYSLDIEHDPRCSRQECKAAGFRSIAVLPLLRDGEPIGIIGLASEKERDFKEADGFLTALSNQVALSLVNARLYESVERELQEKKILIRELYHRTKNNMQIISSMVQFKKNAFDDENVRRAFQELDDKILTMALVHQKLYESKNLSLLNLNDYFKDLLELFEGTMINEMKQIQVRYSGENVYVHIDTAVPLGLVINELFTNAVKYAFPATTEGEIRLEILNGSKGELSITFSDNGTGGKDGKNPIEDAGLGLTTVVALVEQQLDGKIRLESDGGYKYTIFIPKEVYETRV